MAGEESVRPNWPGNDPRAADHREGEGEEKSRQDMTECKHCKSMSEEESSTRRECGRAIEQHLATVRNGKGTG